MKGRGTMMKKSKQASKQISKDGRKEVEKWEEKSVSFLILKKAISTLLQSMDQTRLGRILKSLWTSNPCDKRMFQCLMSTHSNVQQKQQENTHNTQHDTEHKQQEQQWQQ